MAKPESQKRRAEIGPKTGAQVNFYLNEKEQKQLSEVELKLKILPGTAKSVLTHYVFAAGLNALAAGAK